MNENPKILLGSRQVAIPDDATLAMSKEILVHENVGTVLNVANDVQINELSQKLYQELEIEYHFLGINDELSFPPPDNFLNEVIEIFEHHNPNRTLLVVCQSGINRSALAVAGILWKLRGWQHLEELLEFMRSTQLRERKIGWLLNNETMVEYLREWSLNI